MPKIKVKDSNRRAQTDTHTQRDERMDTTNSIISLAPWSIKLDHHKEALFGSCFVSLMMKLNPDPPEWKIDQKLSPVK